MFMKSLLNCFCGGRSEGTPPTHVGDFKPSEVAFLEGQTVIRYH